MLPNVFRNRTNWETPSVWSSFFNDDFTKSFFGTDYENKSLPAVNVAENEKEFRIDVAAPGLDKSDFHLNVDDNVLTISSTKKSEGEDKSNGFIRREFNYSSFSRSFSLPEGTNVNDIKASHKNGVLEIRIPKSVKVKTQKEIKIS